MDRSELQQSLLERLTRGDFHGLKQELAELPSADFAEAIEELEADQQAILFRLLPRVAASDVFEYLPVESQVDLIQAMGHQQVAQILDEMSSDDRTALLEELPTQVCAQLVKLLSPEEYVIAVRLLDYDEDSIGRLMTSEYITLREDWNMLEVLEHIRKTGGDRETMNVLFVVDEHGRLLDDIRLRDIILADPEKTVSEIRDNSFVSLLAADPQEEAVVTFRKYDRTVLPVLDSFGGLVGIVTVDDILDVAEEEATEDIQKLGGMEHLDEPYMDISFARLIRKRATWLMVLFIGETFTASAMKHFEHDLERAAVLMLFVPLIISSGGNSGSQASTLIIRAMALGEVTLRDWARVMRRELLSGFSLGGILAVLGAAMITLRSLIWDNYYQTPYWPMLALAVGLSILGIVLWGTIMGSMFPMLLKKLGLDPATSSAPFVATMVDVTGLIIYFGVASYILQGTILK